eukprot:768092-Hanusia_phi.AAC.1
MALEQLHVCHQHVPPAPSSTPRHVVHVPLHVAVEQQPHHLRHVVVPQHDGCRLPHPVDHRPDPGVVGHGEGALELRDGSLVLVLYDEVARGRVGVGDDVVDALIHALPPTAVSSRDVPDCGGHDPDVGQDAVDGARDVPDVESLFVPQLGKDGALEASSDPVRRPYILTEADRFAEGVQTFTREDVEGARLERDLDYVSEQDATVLLPLQVQEALEHDPPVGQGALVPHCRGGDILLRVPHGDDAVGLQEGVEAGRGGLEEEDDVAGRREATEREDEDGGVLLVETVDDAEGEVSILPMVCTMQMEFRRSVDERIVLI